MEREEKLAALSKDGTERSPITTIFDLLDRAAETVAIQEGLMWRMDRATRQLCPAEGASAESQIFWMAHNLGSIEAKRAIDRLVREARLSTDEARSLARVSLGNY